MDYHLLPRKDLQLLCKKHGIPANRTNVFMADALAKKRVPLTDISVNKEADSDLFSVTPLKVSAPKGKGDEVKGALFNNTPFLRRGTKKREGATPATNSDGADERVEVSAAPSREGVGNSVADTSIGEGAAAPLHKVSSSKDLSGSVQREGSKSRKSTKEKHQSATISACVKQKPEDTSSGGQLRAAGVHSQQLETRRRGKSDTPGSGRKAATERTEPKPFTSSAAISRALEHPADGSKTGTILTTTVNAEALGNKEARGKASPGPFEEEGNESDGSYTLETRRSLSESSFPPAEQEDSQPKQIENSEPEAGCCQDSSVEGDQVGESEPGRSQTPPRQRYIVKVTFADEVSIMGKGAGSGGAEKGRPDESKLRRPDTLPITNAGYAVKSKFETRPASNLPFVFRATRQEDPKPRNSKSGSKETIDLKGRVEPKGSIPGASKQEESKTRRAGSEGKETAPVAKVKPEAKASAGVVSSSYVKPSKRPRLGSGSCVVDMVHSSPAIPDVEVADSFEFPATCSDFRILDLPEWAKEFKRKREETSASASAVAHTPVVEMIPSPAPGFSPLKKIEDRVVKLLDRLKGFCWKAQVDAVPLETEAANGVAIAVEEADHIDEEHTPTEEGMQTDHSLH